MVSDAGRARETGGETGVELSTQTLQERYGAATPRRRRAAAAIVALVAVAALAWLAWAALAQARRGAISGSATAIRVLDERHVEVDVDVRRPAGTAVVCTARALDAHQQTVGLRTVPVPSAGADVTHLTIAIGTVTGAAAAELVRCGPASRG